ncbi:MAG: outer membrane protein assembly factor BamD [Bacteroidota bacterium]
MFSGKYKFISILLVLAVFSSCHYNKMLKSTDLEAKQAYAIKLYEKKKYYKALPLFEELITMFRGTKKSEMTYYYYAYTNYYLEDYETAAYDFGNFANSFPTSQYAEECAYMHAYCYYLDSPEYALDQSNTTKALNELQLFIDQYPHSTRIEECNKLIDKLRYKLETKDYENAKLYYHMQEYKSSYTAFRNLLKDYPSTIYREESMFLTFKSAFLLAENSFEEKKSERYSNAMTSYSELISAYPEGKYKKDADRIAEDCKKRLEKLSAMNN